MQAAAWDAQQLQPTGDELDERQKRTAVFDQMAQVHDRENGNGRAVRNLLERAKRSQAMRLMAVAGRKSKADLMLLTESDFAESMRELQVPLPGN